MSAFEYDYAYTSFLRNERGRITEVDVFYPEIDTEDFVFEVNLAAFTKAYPLE